MISNSAGSGDGGQLKSTTSSTIPASSSGNSSTGIMKAFQLTNRSLSPYKPHTDDGADSRSSSAGYTDAVESGNRGNNLVGNRGNKSGGNRGRHRRQSVLAFLENNNFESSLRELEEVGKLCASSVLAV